MKTLSKLFYISLFIAGYTLSVFFLATGAFSDGANRMLLLKTGLAFFALLIYVVSALVFSMWYSIRDIYARTTPIKAVLLLFVPLFNIYWMHQVLVGFARDYNSFITRNEIETPPLRDDLFNLFYFFAVISLIPFVGALPYILNLFIGPIIISTICNAIHAVNSALKERIEWPVDAEVE
jgi:hypothetical protein